MPNKRPMWSLWVALPLTALPLTAVLAVADANPAIAHEARSTGGFQFVVGWGDEPAYTGLKNSVEVAISEANGGPPVTDLAESLQVEVIKGSASIRLPLHADFGEGALGTPGDYRAWLTPTRPGTYTLHLIGTIRGQSVDEYFTSSENTFDDVDDVADIQFPTKDPSTGQLAARIDRELPRLHSRTDTVEASLGEMDEGVGGARALAMLGMVVGGLALLTAAAALRALIAARRGSLGGGGPTVGGKDAPAEQAGPTGR